MTSPKASLLILIFEGFNEQVSSSSGEQVIPALVYLFSILWFSTLLFYTLPLITKIIRFILTN